MKATLNVPPVGIVADKLTTRRRTGQMFAAVLFTPGMPNLFTPTSLGVESVSKHDGDAIAGDIRAVCAKYKIENDQIAGFGFDGQYFHLHADKKLKHTMLLNERVNFVWLPAHLLQLADKGMRKETEWIGEVCKDISAVFSKFSFGKTFESAIDLACDLGIDFRAPVSFSETRFAAYAHRVFKSFLENYAVVRQVLETIASSGEPSAKEADNFLWRITTLDCVVKVLVCVDMYRYELGSLSEVLQRVDVTFWIKTKATSSCVSAFAMMTDWSADHLTNFFTNKSDLENCMFKGLPLLARDIGLMLPLHNTSSRTQAEVPQGLDNKEQSTIAQVLATVKNKGQSMFAKLQKHIKERFPQEYFVKLQDKADAAMVLPIMRSSKIRNKRRKFSLIRSVFAAF